MDDFLKALQALDPTDLAFLKPVAQTPIQETVVPVKKRRWRRSRSEENIPDPEMVASAPLQSEISPSAAMPEPAVAVETPGGAPVPPLAAEEVSRRKRTHVEREWPPVGTRLIAEYLGVTYRAEIVAAKKRLKSGKQIRLLDSPAKGKRLDSFSKAMLVATAKQRKAGKLGKKGVASGWAFWRRETPDGRREPLD